MAKRNRPAAAPDGNAGETGLQRMQRQAQERARREREARDQEYEESWAELRAALARGEISREKLLGDHTSAPIRVSIGDTNFEISIAATVREVPVREVPARPAEVLPFRQKRASSPAKQRRKPRGKAAG